MKDENNETKVNKSRLKWRTIENLQKCNYHKDNKQKHVTWILLSKLNPQAAPSFCQCAAFIVLKFIDFPFGWQLHVAKGGGWKQENKQASADNGGGVG